MNDSKPVCPRCRSEVQFELQGLLARCPVCGFQYEMQAVPPLSSLPLNAESVPTLIQFIKIAAIVVLILLGTATLVLGVLFVGCGLKGFKP